jgi:hypothetical protein
MRIVTGLVVLLLVACSPSELETHTTSANVDLASIPAMLAAIDNITDDDLPVDELLALTNSVPMDEEKQQRFVVSFRDIETEVLYHVWREQTDWVHVYASSTSQDLVKAVEISINQFERSSDD